jgi:hypothetical protein
MSEGPVDVHEEEKSKRASLDNISDEIVLDSSSARPAYDSTQNNKSNATSLPPEYKRQGFGTLRSPFAAKFTPALTLQNQGSVARDHLASERTFLAYVRTSLAIASTGIGAFYFLFFIFYTVL